MGQATATVSDWLRIERDLIDIFRRLGFRPFIKKEFTSQGSKHGHSNGEWFIDPAEDDRPQLNLSEIARELAALRRASWLPE